MQPIAATPVPLPESPGSTDGLPGLSPPIMPHVKERAAGRKRQSTTKKPHPKPEVPQGKESAEDVRSTIRIRELVAALEDHALGKVEMSASQIRVAEMLIRKVMPDLSGKPNQSGMSDFKVEIIEPQP